VSGAAHKLEKAGLNPPYYRFPAPRTIRFFRMSGDNRNVRSQRAGSTLVRTLGTFDKRQEHFKRRLQLVEEIHRKPDLPSAMHEAGQAFAYEYHDIQVGRCVLEIPAPIVDGKSAQCGGKTEPASRIEITKDNLWPELVCI